MFHSETFRQEQPSTYFVRECREEELTRLEMVDREIGRTMGEKTLEQLESDPSTIQDVLDVGCGAGGWLIETAKAYPTIASLIGVDICSKMVEYAQGQAEAQQVSERVRFEVMDALRVLDFPERAFDLVHQRFGNSYLRHWDWPKLLSQYWRISKPGGVVLIHEADVTMESTSPALTRLFSLAAQAFSQAGHLPLHHSEEQHIAYLTRLLTNSGFQRVGTHVFPMHYQAGTPAVDFFIEDMKSLFQLIVPFLQKWVNMPEDYFTLYEQMLDEIQEPNFAAHGTILEFRGYKPAV